MAQETLLIVGAGLMGSSIGLAAREAGWTVRISDSSAESSSEASGLTGLPVVGEGFTPDLVVVATPPDEVPVAIQEAVRLYPKSIVIDIASVKAELKVKVESLIGISEQYVPTHPMAGKSVSGAANASFDLLRDRRWVICPSPSNSSSALQLVEKLVRDCGATPIYMDVTKHDEAVAFTSHLPQLISSVLAKQLNNLSEEEVAVSGPGLRDMTRLASSDVTLWTQIVKSNNRYIGKAIANVIEDLEGLRNAISTNSFDDVAVALTAGQVGRSRVPGKHGDVAEVYDIVAVLIDDKPGQLASIFRCAEAADINIEDVRIDHALGKAVAIVELSIKPDSVIALQGALRADGWSLRPTVIAD